MKKQNIDWASLVKEWQNSGESQAAFCKARNLPYWTFRSQLKKPGTKPAAPRRRKKETPFIKLPAENFPKSRMGESIQYTKGQWRKLVLFLEKPEVKIHNNDVENGIRPFVIGRKNWLFSGCPAGVQASSLFYSLIETAKSNGLNPYDYLTFLFEKFPLVGKEESVKLSGLLPHNVTRAELSDFFTEYGQV